MKLVFFNIDLINIDLINIIYLKQFKKFIKKVDWIVY